MASEPLEAKVGTVPLASLCDQTRGITYGIVQPGVETAEGVPILRVSDIENGRISTSSLLRVSQDVEAAYERSRLRGGEVLLTLVGAYFGKVAVAGREHAGMNTARAVGVLPVTDDPYYISYALMSPQCQAFMRQRATTTAQPTLNLRDVGQVPVPWPSAVVRRRITQILRAFDTRIDLLRETNATLEAIALAYFKSWFIDFDPVRANTEGREPECMDMTTAALFPTKFDESRLGPIPNGWQLRSLDSIATYLNGLALQKFPPESDDEFLPVVKIAQLRSGHSQSADHASARLKPEYVVHDGDVLFSWSGSLEVEFWCGGDGALNQHLFKVTSTEVPKWFYYLATRHHLPAFREIAAHKATTMGHIQRKHLTEARIAVPPQCIMALASKVIGPLIERRITNTLQARELIAIREALLPHLISGCLHISETQDQIEEALA